ncbi:MAG TPA: hypothetical protein VGN23_01085 [Verrucomicrobiae bacterium]|jgi:hypothetical protein
MESTTNTKPGWRKLRRILATCAVLATLIALFYTEEDWRGKRDWENYKHALEARGEILDWDALIPPSVPDDQNVFGVPEMQRWFIRGEDTPTNGLNGIVTNADKIAIITTSAAAQKFLALSDQYQPVFDLIERSLQRPDTQMDGDYSIPYIIPIANFVNVRATAQFLAQRTKCYLLLGQPDMALKQLTLLNDSRRIMERLPTGHPMTLVDAMINVAVTGLYADTIAYGLQHHAWQEPQLAALQAQLAAINLPPLVSTAFDDEKAADGKNLEILSFSKMTSISQNNAPKGFLQKLRHPEDIFYSLMPHGWLYQNMIVMVKAVGKGQDGFDLQNKMISPKITDTAMRETEASIHHRSPFNLWASIAVPNFSKAIQRLAFNQDEVNEAQIACALERFRLTNGIYPDSLDSLVPKYMDQLPHDIIDGGSFIYRRTNDGKFLLYSIGWNERDDGGQIVLANKQLQYRQVVETEGDWVWQN